MKKWAINNHPETEKLVLRAFRQNLAMISTAKPQKPIGQLVSANAQCPRTDLSKMFLPKPMTTTG